MVTGSQISTSSTAYMDANLTKSPDDADQDPYRIDPLEGNIEKFIVDYDGGLVLPIIDSLFLESD